MQNHSRSAKSKDAVTVLPLELRGTNNLCNLHSSIDPLFDTHIINNVIKRFIMLYAHIETS
jgi:hypothetical protein